MQRWWRTSERTDWGDFEASAQLFTMSMGIFIGCRPYYVRPGTRETSLCVYHLRWDFMVEAMRRYEKRHGGLPEQQAAGAAAAGGGNGNGGGGAGGAAEAKQDAVREALKTPSAARASSTCEGVAAPSNTKYSEPDCLDGKCSSCKDGAKFKSFLAGTVLEAAAAVPQVVDGDDGEGMDDDDDAGGAGPIEDDEDVEEKDGEEEKEPDEDQPQDKAFITYDKWMKIPYTTKAGAIVHKYDFVTVTVPIDEFWADVYGFLPKYLQHHDLAKWCDEEWQNLKVTFKRGEVVLVMDASEAHSHQLRREHQSAYFNQVTSNLWVVVLRFHLDDIGNISDEEKEKLRQHFADKGVQPIIRETHFYLTADKDKDQAHVQYILRDISNYLRATGRWSKEDVCFTCSGSTTAADGNDGGPRVCSNSNCTGKTSYFDIDHLAKSEVKEGKYYTGRGVPAAGVSFKTLKGQSDGCACQFMCAQFLLFLSEYKIKTNIRVLWNWFASCHGKCDCDPEGGAAKNLADKFENKDSPIADERRTIRNAAEFVAVARELWSKPAHDYFSKNGKGVYRRWWHLMPLSGCKSVPALRRQLNGCNPEIVLKGTTTRRYIKTFRRVADTGFRGLLLASSRPCNRAECEACTVYDNYAACKTSPYTECEEVQLDPHSTVAPTPTAGGLADEGRRLAAAAAVGDFLIGETESDETPWWLLKVTASEASVPANYVCPDLHCDVTFDNYGDTRHQRKAAVKVQRFRPEVTGRGQDSSFYFNLDTTIPSFFFPSHLLRSKVEPEMSTRSVRAASGRGFVPVDRAKITAEMKKEVNGKCRVYDVSF